jgi:peptidoglycan/LPS O-acetylase OafA/YrhL
MRDRLRELDGLRAIRLCLVMGYHYFHRFPGFYPYEPLDGFIFIHGALGVLLFFIVSGFIINTTLAHCTTLLEFAVRRISRLWPPMLVCSIVTFSITWGITNEFTLERRVGFLGFIPSLSFTPPTLWRWLSPDIQYVDGAYWTLFVEVMFYFWISVFYFLRGSGDYVARFVVACGGAWIFYAVAKVLDYDQAAGILGRLFVAHY